MTRPCCNRGPMHWRKDQTILDLALADYFDHRSFPDATRREVLAWWAISGSTKPHITRAGQLLTAKLATGWHSKVEEPGFAFAGGAQDMTIGAARDSVAKVILSDPAERLTDDPAGVRLRLVSGRVLRARAAVVALPVNALDQIRFDPPLPKAPAMLRGSGHAGRAVKLLIRARGVAPGHLVTGLAHGLRFLWSDHLRPDGSTLIVGFSLAVTCPSLRNPLPATPLCRPFPKPNSCPPTGTTGWHD